jgi:transcriptional regulator with XRE-family HTH domain
MKNKRLEARRKKIPKEVDLFVKHSFDFVDRIHQILKRQGKEQKDLAKALGKSESEISKWMTGTHNFTFKTAAKIEAVLGESVLQVKEEIKIEKAVRMYFSNYEYQMKPKRRSSNIAQRMSTVIRSNASMPARCLS